MGSLGVIIIGRNEGERLRRCFESVVGVNCSVVYVDSGSTDRSVEIAHSFGFYVVNLDMSIPFTAARARNEGFSFLKKEKPGMDYIQFIDGDCEIFEGWLDIAIRFLADNDSAAVVCGRLLEKYPERTVFNKICQIEWNGPVGEIGACGGIFMVKLSCFDEVGGMNPNVIAAEDDELCVRLRLNNWKIYRIDHDMARHDAAMTHWKQWWKRAVRSGYAYSMGYHMHGMSRVRHFAYDVRSILFWGLIVPFSILVTSFFISWLSLSLIMLYPLLSLKIYIGLRRTESLGKKDARLYSIHCTAVKIPQIVGLIKFFKDLVMNKDATIIEHK